MCTMSIICPRNKQLRIAFNRDELLTRPPGSPPTRLSLGGRESLFPVDSRAGGTWIAVNDAGLAMAVLNLNQARSQPGNAILSRGKLIPMLLHATGTDEVMQSLQAISLTDFDPFRLIVFYESSVTEFQFDGSVSFTLNYSAAEPLMFTSSGLGDDRVERPRRMLFNEIITRYGATPKAQTLFHNHVWHDRPHISVRMSRENARTVSQTVIEIDPDRAVMTYAPSPPYAGERTGVRGLAKTSQEKLILNDAPPSGSPLTLTLSPEYRGEGNVQPVLS